MKLKCSLKTMRIADELLAVPTGDSVLAFRGAIRVNEVAADILKLLQTEISEDEIIRNMMSEYNASFDEMMESVHRVIQTLRNEGLLLE